MDVPQCFWTMLCTGVLTDCAFPLLPTRTVFSALSHICMLRERLWGLCFIFFWIKNLLLLWVNFSLTLGILLVMLHFGESNQVSKPLRLLSDRNSVSPVP